MRNSDTAYFFTVSRLTKKCFNIYQTLLPIHPPPPFRSRVVDGNETKTAPRGWGVYFRAALIHNIPPRVEAFILMRPDSSKRGAQRGEAFIRAPRLQNDFVCDGDRTTVSGSTTKANRSCAQARRQLPRPLERSLRNGDAFTLAAIQGGPSTQTLSFTVANSL